MTACLPIQGNAQKGPPGANSADATPGERGGYGTGQPRCGPGTPRETIGCGPEPASPAPVPGVPARRHKKKRPADRGPC